jgi:hypothetical protein
MSPTPLIDLRSRAREVVESERYVVLATVSPEGVPWSCPVWFAHDDLDAFFWLSRPGRTHSVNVAHQPRIGLVAFDSRQPTGVGLAVYASADASAVPDSDLDEALAIVSARSLTHGGGAWDRARISSAPLELYVARPVELWLNPGLGTDERRRVPDA